MYIYTHPEQSEDESKPISSRGTTPTACPSPTPLPSHQQLSDKLPKRFASQNIYESFKEDSIMRLCIEGQLGIFTGYGAEEGWGKTFWLETEGIHQTLIADSHDQFPALHFVVDTTELCDTYSYSIMDLFATDDIDRDITMGNVPGSSGIE